MPDILSGLSPSTYTAVEPVAKQYGVPDLVWESVAIMESGGNPNSQNTGSYATGLFQLMPNGGQADSALRDGYTLQDLKNPALNAKYAMPSIAKAYNSIKSDPSYPDATWWIRLASLSGHPYEDGDKTNSYTIKVGLQMKTISEKIASSLLSKKYQDAWNTTGNVSPIDTAIDNAVAGSIPVVAPALQSILDHFSVSSWQGIAVNIGVFILAVVLIIIGFVMISEEPPNIPSLS